MTSQPDPHVFLLRAIDAVGSQSALARVCGVSQPAVNAWVAQKKALPAEQVLKVETATGVSRHDLRPDLYPRESAPDESDTAFNPDRRAPDPDLMATAR